MAKHTWRVTGMTCVNCERRIEQALKKQTGVSKAKADFSHSRVAVTYDPAKTGPQTLAGQIEAAGYRVVENRKTQGLRAVGAAVILFAVWFLANRFGLLDFMNRFPQAGENTSYAMLFVIGLMTSVHCIAMCGGINLSQNMKQSEKSLKDTLLPGLLYNGGRVISYTVVGALVGALGSVISLSPVGKGVIALIAGVFMLVMGLSFLGILPDINRLVPRMPKVFGRLAEKGSGKGPLVVGLLNGLMPCGPLQAMQIYALGTGSLFGGALSMFLFSLGTVPLMLAFGTVGRFLSRKNARKLMAIGAALVILMGIGMLQNGLGLAGIGISSGGDAAIADTQTDVQKIRTAVMPNAYPAISVEAGKPVEWTLVVDRNNLNGCNYMLQVPEYGLSVTLDYGENVVEFTPSKTGTFAYSCWMGMIRSTITVT